MKKRTIFSLLFLIGFYVSSAQTNKLFELMSKGKASVDELAETIENGADVNAIYTEENGWMYGLTPAHIAAAYAQLDWLKLLESKGADIIQKVDIEFPDQWWNERHQNCAPFHVGVYYYSGEKSEKVLDYLIDKGADVNQLCYGGQTPLMYALMSDYSTVKTLKYLVSKGANVKKYRNDDPENDGVLYYCLLSDVDRTEEAEYLIQQGAPVSMSSNFDNWDLLAMCIYFNENQIAELLLKYNKIDLNRSEYLGYPVSDDERRNVNNYLHFAVLCGNYQITKALLDKGLSPDATIADGATAYDCAKQKKDETMLNLLRTKQLPASLQKWIELKESGKYSRVNFKVQNKTEPFEIETVDGITINNNSLKGKVVLLNFWATWCGFCIKEMPEMDELANHFGNNKMKILAVSVDSPEDEQKMHNFIQNNDYNFIYAFDPGRKKFDKYSSALPGTYILDKSGKIRAKVDGAISWADDKYIELIETIMQLD